MARDDIMPWDSANGGTARTNNGYIAASETFDRGEPVRVEVAGTITECADDPTSALFLGIAAAGPGTANTNKYTGDSTWAVNTRVPIWVPTPGDKFITDKYALTTGAGFGGTAPAIADIGDEVGLALISGVWGLTQDASNNICRIYDVLDANKDSIQITGNTLTASTLDDQYYVVFEFVASQSLPVTGVATAPGA